MAISNTGYLATSSLEFRVIVYSTINSPTESIDTMRIIVR